MHQQFKTVIIIIFYTHSVAEVLHLGCWLLLSASVWNTNEISKF